MKNKGFTLVELLVVIVIIGILAAAAISVFGGGTDKAKLNTVKNDVAAMHSSGTLAIADQGWDETRDVNELVAEGYLSEVPINSYNPTNTQAFYAYAASKVSSGQTTNPIVLAGGWVADSPYLFSKGGNDDFAIAVSVTHATLPGNFDGFSGAPHGSNADNWTGTVPPANN